jgi:hypothetical protein
MHHWTNILHHLHLFLPIFDSLEAPDVIHSLPRRHTNFKLRHDVKRGIEHVQPCAINGFV